MLQVRNLPDDVHLKLKRRAADAGMSLSDYVGRELARLVSVSTVAEVMSWAEKNNSGLTLADLEEFREESRAESDTR
ncbi:MAG TPA: antitoxin [Lacisediminihabitans sp.]|uniref:FitA-like ribbon-helix-helix domain-containing protein n=1 Tax=Lacisediminihabitans sp. TaxID=2787631 RepID=UPI002ED9A2BD